MVCMGMVLYIAHAWASARDSAVAVSKSSGLSCVANAMFHVAGTMEIP
jgi:hypothetical protein